MGATSDGPWFVPASRGPKTHEYPFIFPMIKSPHDMTLAERKVDLVLRMYVDLGDQDYLTARWGFHNGIFHTFYWSGAQAVEKYLKSILLLRDVSVEPFRHNLSSLLARVKRSIDPSLLPKKLKIPRTTAMGRMQWHNRSFEQFIEYLSKFGSPENRYAAEGAFITGPVLHALDFVCLHLRIALRRASLLSDDLFAFRNMGRTKIRKDKDAKEWMIDGGLPLERLYLKQYLVGQSVVTRRTFRAMNVSFFPKERNMGKSFGGLYMYGPPLQAHLIRSKNERSPEGNDAIVDQLREWVGQNMLLGEDVRRAIGLPPRNGSTRDRSPE